MKRLILVRHAKSDWPEETEDFDRPLADKGLQDALMMSKHLKNNNIDIDYFVSSPAVRALSTCKIINQAYHKELKTEEKLYNPSESNFNSVIYDLQNEHQSVALFSHNNGISNFANSLIDTIFHFPTCGVAGIDIDCESWLDFDGADKKLVFFYDPQTISK